MLTSSNRVVSARSDATKGMPDTICHGTDPEKTDNKLLFLQGLELAELLRQLASDQVRNQKN